MPTTNGRTEWFRLVSHDHDQRVGSRLDRRLEDVCEEGSPRHIDEPLRLVVGEIAESTAAPGNGDDRIHVVAVGRGTPESGGHMPSV